MSISLEEEITFEEESVNSQNFLGNSLLASVLTNEEKAELFPKVQDYILHEGERRGYAMTLRQGLTSFFIDSNNRHYLEKLELRTKRVLVKTFCDNGVVQHVQIPQLEIGYRDRRYFMCGEENRNVTEEEAKKDFEEKFFIGWATLFRGVYDAVICPKGYNCKMAEEHVVELLDRLCFISEQEWMESVHGQPAGVSD
jgi:hypothetical protein